MKRMAAPLLFILCAAPHALADVGPPAGKKSVPVTTVIEVADDFPDYAFFEVSYSSTPGPPPHGGTSVSPTLHFVVPGTTLKATGDRRSGGSLYAVPRAVAEANPHWRGFRRDFETQVPPKHLAISSSDGAWVRLAQSVKKGEVPGGLSIRFGGSEDLPTGDPRAEITETYRLARTPTGVAFIRPDGAEAGIDGGKCGNRGRSASLLAAGVAFSLALLLGGAWVAWRISRRR
jgi:hypothetical protein